MKLHDFLHRICVIIPLSNDATVCGIRGPCARCTGYFQHVVLYTIVKYSIQYGCFFDSKGPVLHIPVPKGSSVYGKFYRESVLTQLADFYQKRRPCTGVCSIKLLHDNAPAHKSATVQEYQKESGLDVLDHPPYSPDLSPCDFWLFPRLKEMLAGHRFESCCGIGSAVYQCLQHT